MEAQDIKHLNGFYLPEIHCDFVGNHFATEIYGLGEFQGTFRPPEPLMGSAVRLCDKIFVAFHENSLYFLTEFAHFDSGDVKFHWVYCEFPFIG